MVGREVDVRRAWGWCSGPYGFITSKAAASAPFGTDHGLPTVHPIMGSRFDEACDLGLEACCYAKSLTGPESTGRLPSRAKYSDGTLQHIKHSTAQHSNAAHVDHRRPMFP